jgi:hypothetical protein
MSESKPGYKVNAKRSVGFIASFQMDALCAVLRELVLHGIEPGPATRGVLKSLRDEFVDKSSGTPIERIPEVSDDVGTSDLYAIAELVRATNMAFLTPEEMQERGAMGFPVSGSA